MYHEIKNKKIAHYPEINESFKSDGATFVANLRGRLEESTNTIQDLIRVFNKIKVDQSELEKGQIKKIVEANKLD